MTKNNPLLGIGKNILLFGASLLFCFLVLELVLRLAFPQGTTRLPAGIYAESSVAGCYALTPGFETTLYDSDRGRNVDVLINELGFRGIRSNVFDTQTIKFLGDSFTAGFFCEWEELYFNRFVELAIESGTCVQSIAVGVPGYCQREQNQWLSYDGAYSTIAIVVQLYPGNDFAEAIRYHDYAVEDGILIDRNRPAPVRGLLRTILIRVADKSHAARLILRRVSRWRQEMQARREAEGNREFVSTAEQPFYVRLFTDGLADREVAEGYRACGEYLSEMRQWTEEQGLPLFIMIVPDRIQFDRRDWELFAESYGIESDGSLVDRPYNLALQLADSLGISTIDLLSGFREDENPERYYGRCDKHFSPEGHARVGEILLEELADPLELQTISNRR